MSKKDCADLDSAGLDLDNSHPEPFFTRYEDVAALPSQVIAQESEVLLFYKVGYTGTVTVSI